MSVAPHPEMQRILQVMQSVTAPDLERLPITEARAAFARTAAGWNRPLPELASDDRRLGGVPCRVLQPPDARGVVLFVHGGGWTFGNPDTHDRFARLLAEGAQATVLVPDYRLAPEHPCPAAIDDVLSVLTDIGSVCGADEKLVLCGDSAGANIALSVALARPPRAPVGLSLLYGCFAPDFDTDSHRRNGDGRYGLSTSRMRWYWNNWLGAVRDPRAAPLNADLSGLPRVHLLAAGLDPLCDDSIRLAERLAAYGVPTRLDIVPGVIHGFLQMTAQLSPAVEATEVVAQEIHAMLNDNNGRFTR